ncbi:hypothetical protein [Lewinella sp. IMCC34183]|uniref:hypothetical protein n=1 Tax=Lewinella sp. IMCC34183 TaxID=2248762 RepID=UPI000E27F44F|nr:hypothetical protein [Lewinella sp. IMCC34183]
MKRDRLTKFRYGVHEFFYTLLTFPRAWRFMLNHRLWNGLRQYGWVARGLVVTGVLMGLFMIGEVVDWWQKHTDDPIYSLAIGGDSLLLRLVYDAYDSLSDGALNYVVLVLLEVVTYHFMRRTLQIIIQKDVEEAHLFRPFLQAQIRMFKVLTMGLILQTIIVDVFGEMLPGSLQGLFAVLVEATILGYAIADNYNEQFDLGIRQSLRHLWRHHVAICMGLGIPLFIMLKVPLFGTVLGPLVTSVAAGIVLREKSDLHLVGYRMSAKEQEKADRRAAKRARKEEKAARSLS